MDVDNNPETLTPDDSRPDRSRREFVRKSGKALYIAPALTLLASSPASAIPSGGPPPTPGGLSAPAPPAPTE